MCFFFASLNVEEGDFESFLTVDDLRLLKKSFYEEVIKKQKNLPENSRDDPRKLKQAGINNIQLKLTSKLSYLEIICCFRKFKSGGVSKSTSNITKLSLA